MKKLFAVDTPFEGGYYLGKIKFPVKTIKSSNASQLLQMKVNFPHAVVRLPARIPDEATIAPHGDVPALLNAFSDDL